MLATTLVIIYSAWHQQKHGSFEGSIVLKKQIPLRNSAATGAEVPGSFKASLAAKQLVESGGLNQLCRVGADSPLKHMYIYTRNMQTKGIKRSYQKVKA